MFQWRFLRFKYVGKVHFPIFRRCWFYNGWRFGMRNLQAVICIMLMKSLKSIWFSSLLLVPTYFIIWTVFARIILFYTLVWKKKSAHQPNVNSLHHLFTECKYRFPSIADSQGSGTRSSSTRAMFYKTFHFQVINMKIPQRINAHWLDLLPQRSYF